MEASPVTLACSSIGDQSILENLEDIPAADSSAVLEESMHESTGPDLHVLELHRDGLFLGAGIADIEIQDQA